MRSIIYISWIVFTYDRLKIFNYFIIKLKSSLNIDLSSRSKHFNLSKLISILGFLWCQQSFNLSLDANNSRWYLKSKLSWTLNFHFTYHRRFQDRFDKTSKRYIYYHFNGTKGGSMFLNYLIYIWTLISLSIKDILPFRAIKPRFRSGWDVSQVLPDNLWAKPRARMRCRACMRGNNYY